MELDLTRMRPEVAQVWRDLAELDAINERHIGGRYRAVARAVASRVDERAPFGFGVVDEKRPDR